jgi:TPR repeat protein
MLQDVNAAWETIRNGGSSSSNHGFSQPPQTAQPPISAERAKPTAVSALAVTSFVLTFLGLMLFVTGIGPLLWIGAIVLAHAARSSIRKHGYRGRWMANFSMWAGYVGWIGIVALLAYIWGTNLNKRVVSDYQSSHLSAPSSQGKPIDQFDHPANAPTSSTESVPATVSQASQGPAASVERVATDSAEAAAYRLKATAGDVQSARKLALLYYKGQGVRQDYVEAFFWFRTAAAQGDAEAQKNIGNMYFNGDGGKSDPSLAAPWYQKAAAQENADAQYHLGLLYQTGLIGASDDGQALSWYQKSAAHGNADAEDAIGDMYQHGSKAVAIDLNQALSWYQKAAAQGNAESQLQIAEMYENGSGATKNLSAAIEWYRKGAAQDQDLEVRSESQKALRRLGY